MVLKKSFVLSAFLAASVGLTLVETASSQVGPYPTQPAQQVQPARPAYPQPAYRQPAQPQRPTHRVADRTPVAQQPQAKPAEHPLMPAIRWAYNGLGDLEKIQDYSAVVVKRERIDDELLPTEQMFVKIRHKPFSVYMHFLGPEKLKGREVIYIEGANDGNMWAHTTGIQHKLVGTVSIAPTSRIAMMNQRYPLTEIGVLNLTKRLVEVAEHDAKYGECDVQYFSEGVTINKRACTCIQVTHPVPRSTFLFHLARIFVDQELNIPIRYEAHDWPDEKGGKPKLLEEYTYLNLKLNNGFTDADFDPKNPNYNFY